MIVHPQLMFSNVHSRILPTTYACRRGVGAEGRHMPEMIHVTWTLRGPTSRLVLCSLKIAKLGKYLPECCQLASLSPWLGRSDVGEPVRYWRAEGLPQ
jgi:hypothetical protein